jgi:hypothetical protein
VGPLRGLGLGWGWGVAAAGGGEVRERRLRTEPTSQKRDVGHPAISQKVT